MQGSPIQRMSMTAVASLLNKVSETAIVLPNAAPPHCGDLGIGVDIRALRAAEPSPRKSRASWPSEETRDQN